MKSWKLVLPLLLALNFLSRLIILLRPLKFIDGLVIPDDAYLALTIARNIAHGLGPLYGLDYTNGFQPLYVFLVTPLFWIFKSSQAAPVHASLLILAIFDTAALFMLFKLVKSTSKSSLIPILISLSWILNPYVIGNSLNGLETIISAFFIITCLYYYNSRLSGPNPSGVPLYSLFIFGGLLGLAVLTRIDNGFLALSIVVVLIWELHVNKVKLPKIAESVLLVALAILIVNLPWLVYSFHYTGDIYPVSGKALRYMSLANVNHNPTFTNWYRFMIKFAAEDIIKNNLPYIAIIISFMCAWLYFRREPKIVAIIEGNKVLIIMFIFCALLAWAYSLYVFGDWFFERYLFPFAILFMLIAARLIDLWFDSVRGRFGKYALAGFIIVIIFLGIVARPKFSACYFSRDTSSEGYMNLGLWAKEKFDDDTRIAGSQTGALGYFADNLDVINIDGVVNKPCFESLVRKRNMAYLRENGVEYVVGWSINIEFLIKESEGYKPDDLIPLGEIEGFRSWNYPWYLYKVNYQ